MKAAEAPEMASDANRRPKFLVFHSRTSRTSFRGSVTFEDRAGAGTGFSKLILESCCFMATSWTECVLPSPSD